MQSTVSEKVIEDILTIDKSIAAYILSVNYSDLSLLARQKHVKSGIIDMLYLHKDELILIELKAVSFYKEVIDQIEAYHQDLVELQLQNKLISAEIRKIILVTGASKEHKHDCEARGVILLTYDPAEVLSRYYDNFKEVAQFLKIQSADFGVSRLGLLNPTLRHLATGLSLDRISRVEGRAMNTIRNRISIATLLNLVGKHKNNFYLTDFGESFVGGNLHGDDRLSEKQKILLSSFIKENPFYSQLPYTVLTLVEAVFVLSKNIHPVPNKLLLDYFVKSVGKTATWRTDKSKETATYIFSNYCIELDFLAKVNNEFFITPSGVHSILLLQLNRSIKLIENQS
jgi:hypothetical protein